MNHCDIKEITLRDMASKGFEIHITENYGWRGRYRQILSELRKYKQGSGSLLAFESRALLLERFARSKGV